MTHTRRLLAGLAAAVTISVVATGCDSSPFAASVNGQVIKQTTLNAQLRQLAGNPGYVALARSGLFANRSVTVTGDSNRSYNSSWSAGVLTDVVIGAAVHQALAREHRLPGPAQLAATRAVDNLYYHPATWDAFSPAYRDAVVARDADLAAAEPDALSQAQLKSSVGAVASELFSDVCVRTVNVTVAGPAGSVDYPASLARAKALAPSLGSPSSTAGAVTCYTSAQFETQQIGFVDTILRVAAGAAAAPEKTVDGYTVLAVTRRTLLPLDSEVGRAVNAIDNQYSGTTGRAVASVLERARVKVNPLYGTWVAKAPSTFEVVPPTASSSSPLN